MNLSRVSLVHDYLERATTLFPDKPALVCDNERLTWQDIATQSGRFAALLVHSGVRRGDRVLVFLDNSPLTCIAVFGILSVGAVVSLVNPETKAAKLSYLLQDSGAVALISECVLAGQWQPVLSDTIHLRHVFIHGLSMARQNQLKSESPDATRSVSVTDYEDALAKFDSRPRRPCRIISLDLAAIIYTSGSSGTPKGVMISHQNMIAAIESITTYLQNDPKDIVLNALPMSFDYGLYQWLTVCCVGATLILERSFNYPARTIQKIVKEKVSGLPLVPTMISRLQPYIQDNGPLDSLRYITNTAAPLSKKHIEILEILAPKAQIFSMYGLTECKRVSYLPPADLHRYPGSVGQAIPDMEVFIVDGRGNRVPEGTAGELIVRGPQVMRGYWKKPEASAKRLRPGDIPGEAYLYTGDRFRLNDAGYLYFLGRSDNMIKSRGGQKIFPAEIERVLYDLVGIREAVVVGEADPNTGTAIRAYISFSADAPSYSVRQIIRHCSERLESYMVPKFITFLSALPTTPSNKVTAKDIKSWAQNRRIGGDTL